MLGVLANDTNDAAAVDDFALVANLLYWCSDLHETPKNCRWFNFWPKPGARHGLCCLNSSQEPRA